LRPFARGRKWPGPWPPARIARRWPRTDEVVNRRHGSPARPQLHPSLAKDAPLGQLLEQFQTLRADLRFREDGVNTVLTIQRQRK
jgi:hypothetical protein